jgi:DNA-binding CsgD family transcriptional regulator/pimeloyl-ACP methyl ester carboxylesterase
VELPGIPQTHYARNGDVHIAWQAFGSGPPDIVFVAGFISHVECQWDFASLATFLRRLGQLGRVIVFDKRGTGMSDHLALPATLEQRIDDMRAVMDAAGSRHAVLFGTSEGVPASLFFAATWPQRTLGLVAYGGSVVGLRAPDYPWAPTYEEREQFARFAQAYWSAPFAGDARMHSTEDPAQYQRSFIAALAPSARHEPGFAEGLADYLRRSASPGAVAARPHERAYRCARRSPRSEGADGGAAPGGRPGEPHRRRALIAQRIAGARLVELQGDDHFPTVGDTDSLLLAVEDFIRLLPPARAAGPARVTRVQARWAGRRRKRPPLGDWIAGDGRAEQIGELVFDGPVRALLHACRLRDRSVAEGLPLAIGVGLDLGTLHTRVPLAVDAGRLAAHAAAGEVMAAAAVRDVVAGSGLVFADRVVEGALAFRVESSAAADAATVHPAQAAAKLSPRQTQVLRLVAEGRSNREIATLLHRSEHTVHRHVQNILNQLAVSSRAAAVAEVARAGLL